MPLEKRRSCQLEEKQSVNIFFSQTNWSLSKQVRCEKTEEEGGHSDASEQPQRHAMGRYDREFEIFNKIHIDKQEKQLPALK